MFKVARWRSEKNRIRAVFKLQFQVTQVPRLGSEMLMVSLIPVDVGRATVRSDKAAAGIDGTCNWKNPIYETVKLVLDPRTGKINEKVYHFIVSAAANGSSKAGFWGEAIVNLAEYAEVFKPSSVSLPLQASKTGAILHVTIQRMQNDSEGREFGENGDTTPVRQQRKTLQSQLSKCDEDEVVNTLNGMNGINPTGDGSLINSQTIAKFSSSRNIPLHADYNSHLEKSHSFDAISPGSDNSLGIYTLRENNNIRQNNIQINSSNGNTPQKTMTSSGDWSGTSAPDGSTDGSTSTSGETGLRELQDSEENIEKLRSELALLTRKAEVSDLELQTLKKQIVKECRRGQDLSREISSLKEERDAFRKECEELRLSQRIRIFTGNASTNSQLREEDPQLIPEEIREELDHEKNANANLRLQLQKTQEANSELILAVKDLDELLEQRNREMPCTKCSKMDAKANATLDSEGMELENRLQHLQKSELKEHLFEKTSENDTEEQHALDMLLNEHNDMKAASSLEKKIIDLTSEVEMHKKEREDLEMQMEQLALDYEILKQENHDISTKLEQTQLREQLRMQYECSAHLAVINDLETHVECLENELQNQAEAFEADLATVTLAKVEQEKRAIQAEEELRKAKCRNADAVDWIQKEVKKLNAQMSYAFDWNEKLVLQALKEASELLSQKSHLNGLLDKSNEDLATLQGQNRMRFQQLLGLIDFKSQETDRLLLELQEKKEELENQKKIVEARMKSSSEEMQMLETEIKKLKEEKSILAEQIELKEKLLNETEQLRISPEVNEKLIQEKDLENAMLKKEISLLKEEINKSLEEVNDLRNRKDAKDAMITMLDSEAANLIMQYSDLKHFFSRDKLGEENLKRLVYSLGDGPFEEEMITKIKKNLEDNCTTTNTVARKQLIDSSSLKELKMDLSNKTEEMERTTKGLDQSNATPYQSTILKDGKHMHQSSMNNKVDIGKDIGCQKQPRTDNKALMHDTRGIDREPNISSDEIVEEEMKQSFDSCIYRQHKTTEALSEIAALKRQNEIMGTELKEMQERYSEISLKFAEVEGERQQLVMTIRTLKNASKN